MEEVLSLNREKTCKEGEEAGVRREGEAPWPYAVPRCSAPDVQGR